MTDELYRWLIDGGVDVIETRERFSGNEALLLKYLRAFPEDPSMAALRQAKAQGDREEMRVSAHTLKGISGTLGMNALYIASGALTARLREDAQADVAALYDAVEQEYGAITRMLANAPWE